MARPKYEEQFKKKLQERELNASSNSWDRLNEMMDRERELDLGKKESSSPLKWWMGIAAAFVAGMFVMNFFFRQQPTVDDPVLVDETSQEMKDNELEEAGKPRNDGNKELLSQPVPEKQYASQEGEETNKNEPAGNFFETEQYASELKEEEKSSFDPEEVQYASAVEVRKSEERIGQSVRRDVSVTKDAISAIDDTAEKDGAPAKNTGIAGNFNLNKDMLAQKLEQVVAEANLREEVIGEVSDAEIEALLLAASTEIEREQERFAEKLSADDLLYEVEMELEESFRAKVFELLKEGFRKTRTAVVNRNN